MARAKRKFWAALAIVLFLGIVGAMFVGGLAIFTSSQFNGGGFLFSNPIEGDKVALVRVEDMIISSEKIVEQLERWADDDSVKAIILRVVSPGGGVAPSQEIYQAVLKAKKKKPIVTSMGVVAASGGYYIAAATDKIIATPGTITGSIGVIVQFSNMEKLFEKIGMAPVVLKSGKYKDTGSPYRPFNNEDRKLMQSIVDDIYNQFIEDVANSRNMDLDDVKKLADGRVYTGRQAHENGLVDELGTYTDSIKAAAKLAKIGDDPEVVEERDEQSFLQWLMGEEFDVAIPKKLYAPSGVYYLWPSW